MILLGISRIQVVDHVKYKFLSLAPPNFPQCILFDLHIFPICMVGLLWTGGDSFKILKFLTIENQFQQLLECHNDVHKSGINETKYVSRSYPTVRSNPMTGTFYFNTCKLGWGPLNKAQFKLRGAYEKQFTSERSQLQEKPRTAHVFLP